MKILLEYKTRKKIDASETHSKKQPSETLYNKVHRIGFKAPLKY